MKIHLIKVGRVDNIITRLDKKMVGIVMLSLMIKREDWSKLNKNIPRINTPKATLKTIFTILFRAPSKDFSKDLSYYLINFLVL